MAEMVTLELLADLADRAREAARLKGRSLEAVLTEWIASAAAQDALIQLVAGGEFHVYTPYGNEAAAGTLLAALEAEQESEGHSQPGQG